ncbi:hypothetical protein SBD_1712 [Streptomyces bottropensis ATCC 25435]|uniref:Uncharacterized protein n=1 Tax=Streptomyces bottropensis ATCC 25435 TaxID=1054862 RepID=M3EKG2_9ACTN|nr:hypothetical protein SBD_1712 [Streptomyces bottropensis ATCC 25435]
MKECSGRVTPPPAVTPDLRVASRDNYGNNSTRDIDRTGMSDSPQRCAK